LPETAHPFATNNNSRINATLAAAKVREIFFNEKAGNDSAARHSAALIIGTRFQFPSGKLA
jgi:hypothetical protein